VTSELQGERGPELQTRAVGGPIDPAKAYVVGESGCAFALPVREATLPEGATITFTGQALTEARLVEILRQQVGRYNRRRPSDGEAGQ
jgi:hypothetical protein